MTPHSPVAWQARPKSRLVRNITQHGAQAIGLLAFLTLAAFAIGARI